jgi:hypothetical protein
MSILLVQKKGAAMRRYIPIIFFIMVILTACGTEDPRREAQAYETRSRADQEAASAEQQRQFALEEHQAEMTKQAWRQQVYDSTLATAKHVANFAVYVIGLTLGLSVCALLIYSTRTINETIKGIGAARVKAADIRAHLIPLDPMTRQYPAFLQYVGNGKFSLANLNTDSVMLLDTRNKPDQLMIRAMGATQYAGALAQEARQADDPAGVSIIRAPYFVEEER